MLRVSTVEERFHRLLARLMDGGVVPLLGAGVSRNAKPEKFSGFEPTLKRMKEKLLGASREGTFLQKHFARRCDNAVSRLFVDTLLLRAKKEGGKPPHLHFQGDYYHRPDNEISFDRLAEIYGWLQEHGNGQAALCQALQIEKFTLLKPTPAHCYLAYLAREGLIAEVLTTNYDCCLEEAWRTSFHDARKVENCRVVTTLDKYRCYGGHRWSGNCATRQPILLLYKLNGCAREYEDGKATPDTILLTERQLQNHHDNPWKRDLLKDRLRSHTLVLCGFGSDEPQVRFLALEIFTEFQRDGASVKSCANNKVWELPNAPYISAHRYLSFQQLQIMEGFLAAHTESNSHEGAMHDGNVFCGKDASALGGEGDRLSADLFFCGLFQGAYLRLLQRYIGPGSSFYNWLNNHSHAPQRWVSYLNDELQAGDIEEPWRGALFGGPVWRKMLMLDHRMGARPLPWMRLVRSTMPPAESAAESSNGYLPLADAPVTLPALLLLLVLLEYHKTQEYFSEHSSPGEGLVIWLDHHAAQWLRIVIVQRAMADAGTNYDQPGQSRLSFRITIPDIAGLDIERRWSHMGDDDGIGAMRRLTTGRERNVPLSLLIKRLGSPEYATRERVAEVLMQSVLEDYAERPGGQRLHPLNNSGTPS